MMFNHAALARMRVKAMQAVFNARKARPILEKVFGVAFSAVVSLIWVIFFAFVLLVRILCFSKNKS